MSHRIITNAAEMDAFTELLGNLKLPITVEWVQGRDRTREQNKLQRLWCNEVSDQLGDRTPEEVRAESKLTIGVPILRAADEEFRDAYDDTIRGLPYEQKLACMMEPIDLPVTRRMKVPQMIAYLDQMHRHWSEKGVRLTDPDPEMVSYQARYRGPVQRRAA